MAADNVSAALLADVKSYVGVTWEDPDTDKSIRIHIAGGISYLTAKIGRPISFEREGYPRSLLFDYVRYARDGATDVFEANYKHLIVAAQNKRKVDDYAAEAAVSQCE